MSWITDKRRPEIIETFDGWGKSKRVIILLENGEVFVAEFNSGIEEGKPWEQWFLLCFDDAVETIIGWCDCIPD
jgi:hypothetical protein